MKPWTKSGSVTGQIKATERYVSFGAVYFTLDVLPLGTLCFQVCYNIEFEIDVSS